MPTRSQEEILFAAHLLPALGLPGDLDSVLRALKADEGSKRPWDVCVEVEGIPVSVDYDGQYYHSADRQLEKDAEKTMDRVQRSDKDVVARVRVGAPAYLGLWLTPEEERRCEVINIRIGLRPSQQVQCVMDQLEEMLPGLAEARKEKVVAITGVSSLPALTPETLLFRGRPVLKPSSKVAILSEVSLLLHLSLVSLGLKKRPLIPNLERWK